MPEIEQELESQEEEEKSWYVDIPTQEMIGDDNGAWKNVGIFSSKEEALAFIREKMGIPCDDDGNVSLLSGD